MTIDKDNIRDVLLDNIDQMNLYTYIKSRTDYFISDDDLEEIENIIGSVIMDLVKDYDLKIIL